jgi:PAS domain S-box-containing protein
VTVNLFRLLLLSFLFALQLFSATLQLNSEEKAYLADHPFITASNETDYAPWDYNIDGKPLGYSIDLLELIAKKLQIKIVYKTDTWANLTEQVIHKEIDLIHTMFKNDKRTGFIYSDPYKHIINALFVNKGSSIRSFADLNDQRLSIPKGDSTIRSLKSILPKLDILTPDSYLDALKDVAFGRAAATVLELNTASHLIREYSIPNIDIADEVKFSDGHIDFGYRFATHPDNRILIRIINKTLANLSAEELERLESKWLHQKKSPSTVQLKDSELTWLRSHGPISFTADPNWLPFEAFEKDGTYIGIVSEHLRLVEERTAITFEKQVPESWSEAVAMAESSSVDVISGVIGESFSGNYLPVDAYLENPIIIVADRAQTYIDDISAGLKGKRVAIIKDYGYVTEVKQRYPELTFTEVENVQAGLKGLSSGQYDAMVGSIALLSYHIQKLGLYQLHIAGQTDISMQLTLFVKKELPELHAVISRAMETITPNEQGQILRRWFTKLDSPEKPPVAVTQVKFSDILPVTETIVAVLLLSLLIFAMIRQLNKRRDVNIGLPLFLFISMLLGLIGIATMLVISNLEQIHKGQIRHALQTVAYTSHAAVKAWYDSQVDAIDYTLQSSPVYSDIVTLASAKETLEPAAQDRLRDRIDEEHYQIKAHSKYVEDYFLVGPGYNVMASSYTALVGKKLPFDYIYPEIDLAFSGSFAYTHPKRDSDDHSGFLKSIHFFLPIRDRNTNQVVAVYAMGVDAKSLINITSTGRLGNTGETYLINRKGQMFSSSRFDDELRRKGILKPGETSFLNLDIMHNGQPTLSASEVLDERDGFDIEGYQDYRGEYVLGAWNWDDKLHFGVITEIDRYEAMDSFNAIKRTIYIVVFSIIGFVIVLMAFILWLTSRNKQILQAKNRELEQLLQNFDENVIASNSDLDGVITYASKALSAISGYQNNELLGRPHSLLRHPDTPKETFEDLWQTIASGGTWKGEIKNRTKDGSFYWVDAIITPDYDAEGNHIGYSAIREDITAHKALEDLTENLEIKIEERTHELQEQQQQFESMVSNVTGVIYRCKMDQHWTMMYISDEIERLSGYPVSDFVDNAVRSFADIMLPEDITRTSEYILGKIQKHEKFVNDYRIIHKDGTIRWVRGQGQAQYDEAGNVEWLDGAIFDITDQKELEMEIQQNRIFLNTLLDSQEQIIITTDGKQLNSANETFKDFFAVDSVEEFLQEHKCICDTFATDAPERYLQKSMGHNNWIEYVIMNADETHKVMIKRGESTFVFTVTAARLPLEGRELMSAVFTDITALEKTQQALHASHKKISDSIEYASLIQGALVPDAQFIAKHFDDYFALWQPKDVVGGDIFLFEEIHDENEVILMVIDCTGHGVPGAFVTMLVKAIERQIIGTIERTHEAVSPARLLQVFNRSIKHLLGQDHAESISNAGFDGGIVYYNKQKNLVRFAGANTPLFMLGSNGLKTIKGDRHSIGYKKSDPDFVFTDHEITIDEPTSFYLTTDGYLDQIGGEKEFPFGKKRFIRLIEEHCAESMADQREYFLDALGEYQGQLERNDDLTLVAFRVHHEPG